MEKKRKYYAWAFAIVLLCSCGMVRNKFGRLPGGETSVTIELPTNGTSALTWPSIDGGMVIYVVGVNGSPFATAIPLDLAGSATTSITVGIPNGTYKFAALAWAGPNKLEGQVGCATSSTDQIFSGGSATVNLTISNSSANCNFTGSSPFAASGYNTMNTTNFPALTIFPCNGLSTMTCAASNGNYTSNSSIQVALTGYVRHGSDVQPTPEKILSSCTSVLAGSFPTAVRLPPGSSVAGEEKFIGTTLSFYPNNNSNCSGSPTRTVFYPYGLANSSSVLAINDFIRVDLGSGL